MVSGGLLPVGFVRSSGGEFSVSINMEIRLMPVAPVEVTPQSMSRPLDRGPHCATIVVLDRAP